MTDENTEDYCNKAFKSLEIMKEYKKITLQKSFTPI